ncbi:hypothetical protein EAI_10634 [Harpegnathos saltator]|uniref:Uncharacterized protein n=1 Tax=Harpegnathos saltator TaxID=610380 RepID=E2BT60_HARSA|nr:hypothetical protein EAI_10634 [Harpegnathos saltator]
MGSIGVMGSTNRPATTDMKIDWLVRTVKKMKDKVACKKEIKAMIREIVKNELEEIKLELEEVKKTYKEESERQQVMDERVTRTQLGRRRKKV